MKTYTKPKIIAVSVAIVLLILMAGIINSFKGNPVSAGISQKVIIDYVAKEYSALDLDVGKVHYNFKFSEYTATAFSKSSQDTHFEVHCQNGKVVYDDYDSAVTRKFNTLKRLEDAYSKLAISILSQDEYFKGNTAMVELENWEQMMNEIPLDTPFDKTMLSGAKLHIRLDLANPTIKDSAALFERAHALMSQNGCRFDSYALFSEYQGVLVMIYDVQPADIEGGALQNVLEASEAQGDGARIQVDIRKVGE